MFHHGINGALEGVVMLTDTKLRNLKPKDKIYKINDRDGLYEFRNGAWSRGRDLRRGDGCCFGLARGLTGFVERTGRSRESA